MEQNSQEYKFFYDGVRLGVKTQYGSSMDEVIYTFFNDIQITTNTRTFYIEGGIEHTVIDIKYSKREFAYKALFYDKVVSSELISEEFRDAKTFKPDETNSYETSYFHFMISEKGFAVYKKPSYYNKNKSKTNDDQENNENSQNEVKEKDTADQVFYRILMMYLLALAYNQKMDKLSNLMAAIYVRKQDNNLLEKFMESIHAFDLQFFFENPVKMDRYQTYNLWQIIAKNYNVKAKHDEIKSQVLALADIISRNKEKEQVLLEKKFHKKVSRYAILLAAIPIILEIPIPYSRLMEINIINNIFTYLGKLIALGFEIIKNLLNSLL